MTAAENIDRVAVGPTLDFEAISLTLGRTTILDNVGFQVRPGHVHALVGPNGGGKSSLIKTLLGQTAAPGSPEPAMAGLDPGSSAMSRRPWNSIAACR